MALGAGGSLALAALVYWQSERAAQPWSSEPRPVARAAELATSGLAKAPEPVSTKPVPNTAALPAATAARPNPSDDEASLMAELRGVRASNPARAVELARAGNQRFPDSPEAPERAAILIHALSDQGQASEARGEAEHMVNHYPDSNWVREIEQFTGAHRHRNLRLNAEGQLESY